MSWMDLDDALRIETPLQLKLMAWLSREIERKRCCAVSTEIIYQYQAFKKENKGKGNIF